MERYIILAQSAVTARALSAWRDMMHGNNQLDIPTADPIVFDPASSYPQDAIGTYHMLVSKISAAAGLDGCKINFPNIVAMVDCVRPSQLSVASESMAWDHYVAMLILTFPEIRWAFGMFNEDRDKYCREPNELQFPERDHSLESMLHQSGRSPLFDPTGLREWVKDRTSETLSAHSSNSQLHTIPRRRALAAVIDEEEEYAVMHAYTAFRYGFRADMVTTWELMKYRFGAFDKPHGYSLLIEDLRVNFPDKPNSVHLSELESRGVHCPALSVERDTSRWRFIVTTGQMGFDQMLVEKNIKYLARKTGGRTGIFYKPIGGMADLWDRADLYKDLACGNRSGNAPGFIWPPLFDEKDLYTGHASPGCVMLVASKLIQRASACLGGVGSAVECIRGAVLATESAELLGGKTPTLTLTAISFKNRFEVRAESTFIGVGYHFGLSTRLNEMNGEIASVTHLINKKVRKRSAHEAEATILTQLVLAFRDVGHLEEEEVCLVRLRSISRRINRPRTIEPLAWVAHALLAYGEWLLGSFPRLILLMIFWITVFLFIATWFSASQFPSATGATSSVIGWIFGGGTLTSGPRHLQVLSWFAVAIGAFHVGVLISYLYSLISRK